MVFHNLYEKDYRQPSTSPSSSTSTKRKQPQQSSTSTVQESTVTISAQRRRVCFTENDGIMIPSIDLSLGSHIGTIARNQVIIDRKTRYFITWGMNGVINMSDTSTGSQLHEFNENIDQIKEQLPTYTIPVIVPPEVESCEKVATTIRIRTKEKYLKKCWNEMKKINTNDKLEVIKDLYQFIYKLHSFHKYIFNPEYQEFSEQDYVIKVWSPLFETLLRSRSDIPVIVSHWGDTVPENIKADEKMIKLDLRLISCGTSPGQTEIMDAGTGEFAPKVYESKYYKDKLKTVLSSKAQLNAIIKNYPDLTQAKLKGIAIPFSNIMALEYEIYTLRLGANGVYVVDIVDTVLFPSSEKVLADGSIKKLIGGLYTIKKPCEDVIKTNKDKKDSQAKKARKAKEI